MIVLIDIFWIWKLTKRCHCCIWHHFERRWNVHEIIGNLKRMKAMLVGTKGSCQGNLVHRVMDEKTQGDEQLNLKVKQQSHPTWLTKASWIRDFSWCNFCNRLAAMARACGLLPCQQIIFLYNNLRYIKDIIFKNQDNLKTNNSQAT